MISDFEQRLADVLGGRLPAPFTGNVHVAPGPGAGADPVIVVRVENAVALESGMGGESRQRVPGSAEPRRVVRLACTVRITVFAEAGQGRVQEMQGLDAVLYTLDAPEFRNGSALAGGAPDPGFLIQTMRLKDIATPPVAMPSGEEEIAVLRFEAEGWFWPIGTVGESGPAIEAIRIRGALSPMSIVPARPRAIAGGDAVDLVLNVRDIVKPGGGPAGTFSSLALRLVSANGGPGAGALTGADDGVLVVNVVDGEATFSYEPPDDPARLELVVSLDDSEGGVGMELERFPIVVVEAAP